MRFAQKVALLNLKENERVMYVLPGIRELNRIRNRFGHELDAELGLSDLTEMLKCLSLARSGVEFVDPVAVIREFATVACTFLTIDPEVERIFQNAFERSRTR